VDTEELQITTRNGVVFLEGAVPSETEHEILLNILTDVAGVQEIKDNLEIQRLAWEREDRFKEEAAEDVQPGTIPKDEPYSGTEDPVVADEEGVDYEPPVNQPHRFGKDNDQLSSLRLRSTRVLNPKRSRRAAQ
jgi:BON domain